MNTTTPTRQEMLTTHAFLCAEVLRCYEILAKHAGYIRTSGSAWSDEGQKAILAYDEAHEIYWGMVERRNSLAARLWPDPEHEINDPTEY